MLQLGNSESVPALQLQGTPGRLSACSRRKFVLVLIKVFAVREMGITAEQEQGGAEALGKLYPLKAQLSPYRDSATKGVHKVQGLRPGSPCLQAQLISSPTVTIPLTAVTKALGLQLEGAPSASPCSHGWVSNHCSQPRTSIFSRIFSQFPQGGTGTTPTRRSDVSPPAPQRRRPVPSSRRRESGSGSCPGFCLQKESG